MRLNTRNTIPIGISNCLLNVWYISRSKGSVSYSTQISKYSHYRKYMIIVQPTECLALRFNCYELIFVGIEPNGIWHWTKHLLVFKCQRMSNKCEYSDMFQVYQHLCEWLWDCAFYLPNAFPVLCQWIVCIETRIQEINISQNVPSHMQTHLFCYVLWQYILWHEDYVIAKIANTIITYNLSR